MKNMYLKSLLFFSLCIALTVSGCKKDPDAGTHKVKFKVIAEGGAQILSIVYGPVDDPTSVTGITIDDWTSPEMIIPENKNMVSVVAGGSSITTGAKLTTQIFVDGNKVKENVATGTSLAAQSNYTFGQ